MPAVKPNRVFVSALEAAADGSAERLRRGIRALHGDGNFRGWKAFEPGDPHHRTLLMAAAHRGQPECVQLLIEAGAELDTALDAFTYTEPRSKYHSGGRRLVKVSALALACGDDSPGHIESTALLIAAGANPSATGLDVWQRLSYRALAPGKGSGAGDLQLCMLLAAGSHSLRGTATAQLVLNKARQLPWLSRMLRGPVHADDERLWITAHVLAVCPQLEQCLLQKHPDLLERATAHCQRAIEAIGQTTSLAEWTDVAHGLWHDPLVCPGPTRAAVWTLRTTRARDRIAAANGRARSVFGQLPGPIMIMIQEWVRLLSLPRPLRIACGVIPALQDQANVLRDQWRTRNS